ncbi:MAG: peptidase S8 [Nitrospirae bacterium]|nr:peptidase S8 [Nitrospirota bacterium]
MILLFLIVVYPTHIIEAKTIADGEVTKPLIVEFKQDLFSIHAKEIPLGEVLAEIEKQSGFTISIDESLKRSPVTVSLSDMDIVKALHSIISSAGLGGYGISYRSTSTPGKIGQWVVDRIVLVDKGNSPEMPDKVGSTLTQKDKNQGGEIAKKPKTIEKEPYFDKRLNRYVEVVKGEVLVRFRRDNPLIPPLAKGGKGGFEERVPDELEKFNKEKETKIIKSYEKINAHRLKIPATETVQGFIERHLDAKQVYIEPVFLTHQQAIVVNDPSFKYQWAIPQIQADKAWEINSGSPDTIVAVIDTGIDITHPDLKNRVISGVDIIDGDSSGVDDNGHGTYVAGIIAAEANNSIGIAGVSYKSKLMPVKVLTASGKGTYADLMEGIIYAVDHGARILNLSLGGYSYSQFLGDAIQYAHSSRAVILAAGGNENSDEQLYPAAYPNVIAVSATDPSDQRWALSNYGTYIRLSAPGVGVLSTLKNNGYGEATGTSVSTAHVAGVAALILSKSPNFGYGYGKN